MDPRVIGTIIGNYLALKSVRWRNRPVTCSQAGQLGNAIKRDRARAKRIAKAIEMARNAGRDDLVDRVRGLDA